MSEEAQPRRVGVLVFVTVPAVTDRDAEALARDGVHKALVEAGQPENARLIRFPGRKGEPRELEVAAIQPLSWMLNPDLCAITPTDGPYLYKEMR
jgi:hypothetical protein